MELDLSEVMKSSWLEAESRLNLIPKAFIHNFVALSNQHDKTYWCSLHILRDGREEKVILMDDFFWSENSLTKQNDKQTWAYFAYKNNHIIVWSTYISFPCLNKVTRPGMSKGSSLKLTLKNPEPGLLLPNMMYVTLGQRRHLQLSRLALNKHKLTCLPLPSSCSEGNLNMNVLRTMSLQSKR